MGLLGCLWGLGTCSAWVCWGACGGWGIWSRRVWWRVGILPSIALTVFICFAGTVNCKFLHFLILRPFSHTLLSLLNPLQVALPLLIGVLLAPLLRGVRGSTHTLTISCRSESSNC